MNSIKPTNSKSVVPISSQMRKSPADIQAEISVLGAMLLKREAVSRVTSILSADDIKGELSGRGKSSEGAEKVFYDPKHQEIYKAIVELERKNIIPDIVSLSNYLQTMGTLESIGGSYYISEIASQVATTAGVESHARIIQEKYFKRCLIDLAEEILERNYDETTDVLEEIDSTEAKIFSIAEKRIRKNYKTMNTLANETMRLIEMMSGDIKYSGVPTGFHALDTILNGGLQRSDLIILAARPSMGKTALALSIALNAAMKFQKPVAFFSLEMNSVQLVMRMLSSIILLEMREIRSGRIKEEMQKIVSGISSLSSLPLYFDDSPSLSIMEMRSKCRRLKSERNIELIVVDYLQLIQSIKAESREREISIISATLKQIARELEVPVLALAQLNRSVETRTGKDKIPLLSDLRESGSIEQDADVVMFIHRPEYYEKNKETVENNNWKDLAQIYISKHRNGATGSVDLTFISQFLRFSDREFTANNSYTSQPSRTASAINSNNSPNQAVDVNSTRQDIHKLDSDGDIVF